MKLTKIVVVAIAFILLTACGGSQFQSGPDTSAP